MKWDTLKFIACGLGASFLFATTLFASENRVVKWVFMADAVPINWEENGVAKGSEIEIVQYVCKELKLTCEFDFYPWARAQEMVETGKADAMMTTPTSRRFKYAVFGKEIILPTYLNVFVNKDNLEMVKNAEALTKLEDMKQYELVDFIGNGWQAAFMKQEEGYNVHQVVRVEQIPQLLALDRIDMAINASSWINYWAEKMGVKDQLKEIYVEWPWTKFHYVFMTSRKSPWTEKGLVRALDKAAQKMKEEGVWVEVLKKYKNPHGSGVPFNSTLDDAYFAKGGFYKDYDNYPLYIP